MVPVLGDPDCLQQVLWNLLTNAVRFTSTGGTVNANLYVEGGWARMVVSDTGQGIPSQFFLTSSTAFDKLTARRREPRWARARARDCTHIVELHGGTVEVASDGPGMGATFTVRLPGTQEPPSSLKRVAVAGIASRRARRARRPRVPVLTTSDTRGCSAPRCSTVSTIKLKGGPRAAT